MKPPSIKRIALTTVVIAALWGCAPEDLPYSLGDLPAGDAGRGAALFTQSINGSPACSACHSTDGSSSSGPPLDGYGQAAGTRVKGQSAALYSFYSILRPAKHLVRGYSNVMYSQYADKLSQQDVADLIAYMLGL
ncbi:MAG: c-type cytochrome [Anaerolineae bacterium]|nr:c-type cytochrome [Anaerolineae bacterium]